MFIFCQYLREVALGRSPADVSRCRCRPSHDAVAPARTFHQHGLASADVFPGNRCQAIHHVVCCERLLPSTAASSDEGWCVFDKSTLPHFRSFRYCFRLVCLATNKSTATLPSVRSARPRVARETRRNPSESSTSDTSFHVMSSCNSTAHQHYGSCYVF